MLCYCGASRIARNKTLDSCMQYLANCKVYHGIIVNIIYYLSNATIKEIYQFTYHVCTSN